MSQDETCVGLLVLLYTTLIFILGFAIGSFYYGITCYKEGQIDYANGKIKYELVVNPDQTKEWRWKK